MFMLPLIGLIISFAFIFIGKAVADITSNETSWNKSVFSKWGTKDSFWGSKEHTYKRKDKKNKILNWLFHNPLVFVTDVWHCANTLRRIGIYSSVLFGILLGGVMVIKLKFLFWILLGLIILNVVGFHVFYHIILRKKEE